jgi:hypothetical protein
MAELKVDRMVQAPAEIVWRVISDVVGYAEPAFRRICEALLDNWEVKIKAQMGQATPFPLSSKTNS